MLQHRRRVETDAEGFIRPGYDATGGASEAMNRGKFHALDTNQTLTGAQNSKVLKYRIVFTKSMPYPGPMNGR
jgi:hypothetical protein